LSLVSLGETPLLICHKPDTFLLLEGRFLPVLLLEGLIYMGQPTASTVSHTSPSCLSLGSTPLANHAFGVLFSLVILTPGGNIHLPVMLVRSSPMLGRTLFFTSRCIIMLEIILRGGVKQYYQINNLIFKLIYICYFS